MKRTEILDAAKRCVCGDREQNYGSPSGHAKEDNWVDLAGYAACGGEIETEG